MASSVRERQLIHACWPVVVLAAACSGSAARLDASDAGSPAADAPVVDRGVQDRTPALDLDVILGRETQPPGDEPAPPPEPCDPDAGAGEPPDTNDDIHGLDVCRPVPVRLIVLGDSIAESFEDDTLLTPRFRELAPNVAVEGYAESGSGILSLPAQARRAGPGSGHAFVFIWSIGNDVPRGISAPNADLMPYHAAFAEVFGYFRDQSRFPGGVTFLLNTQYTVRDECDAPGATPWEGREASERWRNLNKVFFLDVAEASSDAVAIDHHSDFLGHTANANIRGCPHCGQDNTQWTDPLGVHPNGVGQAHIAEKWDVAFAQMLGPACGD